MARATKQDRAQDASRAGLTGASEPAAMADPATRLAPVLEGARARGVADAFAMAGQAAILLGGAGEVLHACADARSLLGAGLRLKDGRLVAGDEGDLGLARRLGDVLEGESGLCAPGLTRSAAGGGIMRVRVLSFAGGNANPVKLWKSVVLLDPLARSRRGQGVRP